MAETLADIGRETCKGMGGISHFLVAEWDDAKSFEITDGVASVPSTDGYAKEDFFKFVGTKKGSNWSQAATSSSETGTFVNVETATIIFDKYEATKRAALSAIACKTVIIIAIDQNGQGVLLGHFDGLDMATVAGGSGTAPTDKNGIDLTFTGTSDKLVPTIAQSEIDKLIA